MVRDILARPFRRWPFRRWDFSALGHFGAGVSAPDVSARRWKVAVSDQWPLHLLRQSHMPAGVTVCRVSLLSWRWCPHCGRDATTRSEQRLKEERTIRKPLPLPVNLYLNGAWRWRVAGLPHRPFHGVPSSTACRRRRRRSWSAAAVGGYTTDCGSGSDGLA